MDKEAKKKDSCNTLVENQGSKGAEIEILGGKEGHLYIW